jgi:hypothetical protein
MLFVEIKRERERERKGSNISAFKKVSQMDITSR